MTLFVTAENEYLKHTWATSFEMCFINKSFYSFCHSTFFWSSLSAYEGILFWKVTELSRICTHNACMKHIIPANPVNVLDFCIPKSLSFLSHVDWSWNLAKKGGEYAFVSRGELSDITLPKSFHCLTCTLICQQNNYPHWTKWRITCPDYTCPDYTSYYWLCYCSRYEFACWTMM